MVPVSHEHPPVNAATAPTGASATRMFSEAASAPEAVRNLVDSGAGRMAELARELDARKPTMAVTCGRGSSDHAAAYAKYLIESRLGLVTSSAAPSIASVYGVKLNMRGALYIAISQSGKSPDIVDHARAARERGAAVVALVNEVDSPLASAAHWVVPLGAGAEISVAATKSYLASLAALALLVAHLARDRRLLEALRAVPDAMAAAWECDWSSMLGTLQPARNMFVVGRGVGFALSLEAALKFKETCGVHAEAYSAAEVRHGPMAIVGEGFPLLIFCQEDGTRRSTLRFAADARAQGASAFVAGAPGPGEFLLPCAEAPHELLAPLVLAQSFYRFANALSIARGLDPDRPPRLKKITETV